MFSELVKVGQWKPFVAKVKGYKKRRRIGENYGQTLVDALIPCIDLYDTDGDKVRVKRNEWIFSDILNLLNSFQADSFAFLNIL